MTDTTTQQPLNVLHNSTAAPFIYFDGVVALGLLSGIAQIELGASTVVPDGGGAGGSRTDVVVVAHLRCSLAGLAALKDGIQKIETLLAPAEGKAN